MSTEVSSCKLTGECETITSMQQVEHVLTFGSNSTEFWQTHCASRRELIASFAADQGLNNLLEEPCPIRTAQRLEQEGVELEITNA